MAGPAPVRLSRLKIASTLAETRRLHAWLDDLLQRFAISEKVSHAMRLCIEEAVMNIILHGYGEDTPGAIEISLWPEAPGVLVRVVDRAPAFDPAKEPKAQMTRNLQSGPLGGHGLILMHRYSDILRYEYLNGQNRLTMGFAI